MGFKEYRQTNYSEPIHSAGCGPTSIAILVSAINSAVTPETVANWMSPRGYFTENGSDWNGLAYALDNFGGGCSGKQPSWNMYGSSDSATYNAFKQHLQSGYTAVLLMGGPSYWTSAGHFIAVTGYKDNKYYVIDPANSARDGWHSFSDFSGLIKFVYLSSIKSDSASPATTTYTFTASGVTPGSHGDSVKFWQRMLKGLGFYNGEIDGAAGNQTIMAIRNYQRAYSLVNDGSLGEKTAASIMQGVKRSGMTFTLNQIQYRSTGADVRVEQILLKSFGLYQDYSVDLQYGQGTVAAVTNYQKNNADLVVDGVCGPGTFKSQIGL